MSPLTQQTKDRLKHQYDLIKICLEECYELQPLARKEMKRELKLIFSIYHNEKSNLRNLFDRYNEASLQLLDELMNDNSKSAYDLRNEKCEEIKNDESVRRYADAMKKKHYTYENIITQLLS
jgi:hypothetical protein